MQSNQFLSIFSNIFKTYSHMLIVDTETTGFNPKIDRITELAAIKFDKYGNKSVMDEYISLPDDICYPENVQEITGITPEILEREGHPEEEIAWMFAMMLKSPGRILLVTHNAQFDLRFIQEMLSRHRYVFPNGWGVIDTLTVFRDRKPHPNKLSDAISYYGLNGVKNSHRAIDDVVALCAVFDAMCQEQNDLDEYINVIGVYGKSELFAYKIPGLQYWGQEITGNPYGKLPDLIKKYNQDISKIERV